VFGEMPNYDDGPGEQPRIIGLLSWYQESPGWLSELVQSMAAAGVDHVVAVDGAYAAYPHRSPVSDPGQAQAIVETARGAGVGCSVYVPSVAWRNGEIQKRTFLFAAGHVVCVPGHDWFWVLDGDEVITHHHGLKDILAATTRDVGTVNLWEGTDEHTVNSQPLRMLFRSQPSGIVVGGYHAHYRTGNGDVLWNPSRPATQAPAVQLEHTVRVRHRPGERDEQRTRDRLAYYDRVRDQRLERVP
jgi:hypothetical protein